MTTHKWQIAKVVNHWVVRHGYRLFIADTWEEAMAYATDDKRDENF